MAETDTLEEQEETAPEQDSAQEQGAQQQGAVQASFLDPDVLIVLFLAVIIDVLDVVLAIGVIVNLILGAPLILWMVWKTGKLESGKEQIDRVRQGPQQRANFQKRQQELLAARKKATSRAWKRGVLFFLGGLVPILSIFVLWTWAVVNTVRGK